MANEHELEQARLMRQVRTALQGQDYRAAIENLKLAARLANKNGDIGLEGRHLGNLALIYHRLNNPNKALQYFQYALKCARFDGDRATEDGLLGNMGNILREMGRHDEALEYLNQALLIAQEIGDVRGRGIWLANIGLVFDDLGDFDRAVEYHLQSVNIARELNDQRGLAQRLGNLGNSYLSLGDYVNALQNYQESIQIFQALGDKQGLALRLGIIGNIYAEIGREMRPRPEALQFLQAALDHYTVTMGIARELKDYAAEAELMRSAGSVLAELELYDQAIGHFQAARQLYLEQGLIDRADSVQENIDVILRYLETGNLPDA